VKRCYIQTAYKTWSPYQSPCYEKTRLYKLKQRFINFGGIHTMTSQFLNLFFKLLKIYIIINFRIYKISRDAHKQVRIPMLIKKKHFILVF
jgi:hypothetical protein